MTTNIYNYDGTLFTAIPDGTIDSNHASIRFPGKGFLNYGAPVNNNMLWIMQNFAAASAPNLPVTGQAWYDTVNQILKVYTGTTWITTGGVIESPTPPPTGTNQGALWFDTVNKQLHVWSGTSWLLVGPLGSSVNTDPINPAIPSYSRLAAARISDGANNHSVWEVIIGGVLFAIISKDTAFVPNPAISGFSTIYPGINFNSTIANVTVSGDTTFFRSIQNNLPSADNTYSMGSAISRFNAMYAVTFNGTATSAQYADVAERYESDEMYDAGTVVSLGGQKEITISNKEGSDSVFGVISTAPALLMNNIPTSNNMMLPVALLGRVPCNVIGKVKKNQRLMASEIKGIACVWDPKYGSLAIIGRALSDKTTDELQKIEIFVGKN